MTLGKLKKAFLKKAKIVPCDVCSPQVLAKLDSVVRRCLVALVPLRRVGDGP